MACIFEKDDEITPDILEKKGFKVTKKDGFWWAEGKIGNEYGEIISGNLNIPETEHPMLYMRNNKYNVDTLVDLEILMERFKNYELYRDQRS